MCLFPTPRSKQETATGSTQAGSLKERLDQSLSRALGTHGKQAVSQVEGGETSSSGGAAATASSGQPQAAAASGGGAAGAAAVGESASAGPDPAPGSEKRQKTIPPSAQRGGVSGCQPK